MTDEKRTARPPRTLRADARRNVEALLGAALDVFQTQGVDAPVRDVASKAGVGMGTLYRHFPQRSDLIIAVFRREVDACADAAALLAERHEPFDALAQWMQRYAEFVVAKRGLAAALHSGDPAYEPLPGYFLSRLGPALQTLLDAAIEANAIRVDIRRNDLLSAVPGLSMAGVNGDADHSGRMVALLVDGLRHRPGQLCQCSKDIKSEISVHDQVKNQ